MVQEAPIQEDQAPAEQQAKENKERKQKTTGRIISIENRDSALRNWARPESSLQPEPSTLPLT